MFCSKCGTEIPENVHFCPTCGEPVPAGKAVPASDDKTAMFDPEDIRRSHVLAAVCYLNVTFIIIALLLEPNSKFIRYHVNQSAILYVFALLSVLLNIVPFLGQLAFFVAAAMFFVFTIMGIVRAMNGQAKDLPLVGKYTIVHYD